MIAIGGGGYVPARILRSFLKQPGSPNIPIQAIGLSLYEQLPENDPKSGTTTPGAVEQIGHKVTRTQWLDLTSLGGMENLVGKRILIVDEVDDTRTTLEYAVKELEKDVEQVRQRLGLNEETQFGIFVLHVSLLSLFQLQKTAIPAARPLTRFFCSRLTSPTRTRTSRRRAPCPRTSPPRSDTSRPEPSAISGSATPGRPPTSRSTTRPLDNSRTSQVTLKALVFSPPRSQMILRYRL